MPYTFRQPIRYYKSNDPYYYEVDNIPVRQLEENILHIKDKLEKGDYLQSTDGGGGYLTGSSELDITRIKQLRPSIQGGRTLKVNAGRFMSRVNDVYNIARPLTDLILTSTGPGDTGGDTGEEPEIIPALEQVWTETDINKIWEEFTSTSSKAAFNLNGLEYTYTFHSTPGGLGRAWLTTWPTTTTGVTEGDENYPHYELEGQASYRWPWQADGKLTPGNLFDLINLNTTYNFENLPTLHLSFVRKWRSPFRTAVVDFRGGNIEVPSFDTDDFYYFDDHGQKQQIDGADQRIDLLVVYSMSIDTSSTTLTDYEEAFCQIGGTPSARMITMPTLGIVRGAGIGIKKDPLNTQLGISTKEGCNILATGSSNGAGDPGSKRILGSVGDFSSTANYGLRTDEGTFIHGSFPSPDDLLNQAPHLSLSVEDDDFQLVGQTALPLAYIVVNANQPQLEDIDIIDIRPFLRTTEFTYNERAGVAAANPPLSLANPAVGAFQLKSAVRNIYTKINNLEPGGGGAGTPGLAGKVLYTDYVMGGLAYGVEGTMLTMNKNTGTNDPWGQVTTDQNDYEGYSFAAFTSSKAFLDSQDTDQRKALLQYFYNHRQEDLKKWLSNPNNTENSTNYLGLNSSRNIPLFPEWEPCVDINNYQNVFTDPTYRSVEPTWWMWLEGVEAQRPFRYVPGGVKSTITSEPQADLDVEYQPGMGDNELEGGVGTIQVSTKKLEVLFPSWVSDYDVFVEYVNCTPYSRGSSSGKANVDFGTGLYVNKGPIQNLEGVQKAVFQVMSAAQSFHDLMGEGAILDTQADNLVMGRDYQWLCYSVCLPQFREENWKTGTQSAGDYAATMRYTPKFGASYYPSVKFTIVGYPANLTNYEGVVLGTTNTLIPTNTAAGSHNNILNGIAPVYNRSSINISEIDY